MESDNWLSTLHFCLVTFSGTVLILIEEYGITNDHVAVCFSVSEIGDFGG